MSLEAEIVVISAAQAGSEPAWRQLFAWHFDAVYQFCVALACGRRELAEETAQQVFVTAAQRVGTFDSHRGEFRAWLLGIARNRFMVLQAKERRRRRHEALSQKDFAVRLGGKEIYRGTFWSGYSSESHAGVVLDIAFRLDSTRNTIQIRYGYPGPSRGDKDDPRNNPEIFDFFAKKGMLK